MKKSIKEGLFDKIRTAIKATFDDNLNKKIEKILDTDDTPPEIIKRIAKNTAEIKKAVDDYQRLKGRR